MLLSTKQATKADGVAVSLRDGDSFVCCASVGLAPETGVPVRPGEGICGRCISEAATVLEQGLDGDIKSVAALPVFKDGGVFGFVAGFSIQANAFPPSAVEDFKRLVELIHVEIDPPIAVELKPDSEEDDRELLSQFGISVRGEARADTEDENQEFLSELVREVLEGTSQNAAPIEEEPAPVEPQPGAKAGRTTEEVLMEVVDYSTAAPPPVAAAPAAAIQRPTQVSEKPEVAEPQKISVRETPQRPRMEIEAEDEAEGSEGSRRIIWIVISVVLLLALSAAYFFYFRQKPAPTPRTLPTAQAVQTTSQPNQAQSPAASVPAPAEVKPSAPSNSAEALLSKKKSPPPIVVAESNLPKRPDVTPVEPPTLTLATKGNINAPVIPSRDVNVVFGGERSSGAVPPKLVQRVDPSIPNIARAMHLSGDVRLEVALGADGRVKNVRALQGPNVLANAAMEAVRRWRYEPAKQNGRAVESVIEVTLRFR